MAGPARDVVVVGGGPAGSAAAIFLRQRGHDVLLLDEARFPRDKVCGEGVSPEAWRLLAAMGAADDVRALRPHPLRGMELTSPDGTALPRVLPRHRRTPGSRPGGATSTPACSPPRGARGVEVREGARASALIRGTGASPASSRPTAPARRRSRRGWSSAADGRRSVVARQLGLLREHRRLRKYAVRGYWSGVDGLGEHGEMHVVRRRLLRDRAPRPRRTRT